MKAQKYLLDNNCDDLILNDRFGMKPNDRIYASDIMEKYAKDYHEREVNKLQQQQVSGLLPNDKHVEFGVRTFRNVQMASKVELILKPEHMNTVFSWKQVQDAIMNDGNDH